MQQLNVMGNETNIKWIFYGRHHIWRKGMNIWFLKVDKYSIICSKNYNATPTYYSQDNFLPTVICEILITNTKYIHAYIHTYIHTYIIGHYNHLVTTTTLLQAPLYAVCVSFIH